MWFWYQSLRCTSGKQNAAIMIRGSYGEQYGQLRDYWEEIRRGYRVRIEI